MHLIFGFFGFILLAFGAAVSCNLAPVGAEQYLTLQEHSVRSCQGPILLKQRLEEMPQMDYYQYRRVLSEMVQLDQSQAREQARAQILGAPQACGSA